MQFKDTQIVKTFYMPAQHMKCDNTFFFFFFCNKTTAGHKTANSEKKNCGH